MSHIIVNGNKILSDSYCINAYDRDLTLGHGLFETILINKKSTPLLDYHWNRLVMSIKILDIQLPFDFKELASMIKDLIQDNQFTDSKGGIRLTITDGISERGLLSNGKQKPTFILTTFHLPETSMDSMTATIIKTRRNENSLASRIKSISYLDNILAKKEAIDKGFDEAFLLNSKRYLAEGAISNIFIVKNGIVYTPPIVDGALPGVIRHIILNDLTLKNLTIKEEHIKSNELLSADEIFISNALLGVKPIHKLDNIKFQESFEITNIISLALKKQFNYI